MKTVKLIIILSVWITCFFAMPIQASNGILPIEYELVNLPTTHECYAGLSIPSGSTLFEFCDPTPFTPAETAILRDAVFTHVHPAESCAELSPGDLIFALNTDVQEIRAIAQIDGALRVTSMRRTGKTFPNVNISAIQTTLNNLIASHGNPCAYLDKTWQSIAPRYGLIYSTFNQAMQLAP